VGCKGCSALQKSDFDVALVVRRISAKERLNEGCSGGLRGSGVRDLAKKRLRGCSGGSQRVLGERAIFDVRDGQMADRLVVGKKQCLSSLWNRIIGKVIDS
jgi:hypothetical protein